MKHTNGTLPTTEGHHIVCLRCGATISGSLLYHWKALHQPKRRAGRLAADLASYRAKKRVAA